jgi:hypothetical protein
VYLIVFFSLWIAVLIFLLRKLIKDNKSRKLRILHQQQQYLAEQERQRIEHIRREQERVLKEQRKEGRRQNNLKRLEEIERRTVNKDKIVEFELAGLYYRSKSAIIEAQGLKIGNSVELKRNPNNKYDPFAVKVYAYEKHIGFVPEYYSEEVSTELKKGNGYRAYISRIIETDIPYIWIKLFPIEDDNYVIPLYFNPL